MNRGKLATWLFILFTFFRWALLLDDRFFILFSVCLCLCVSLVFSFCCYSWWFCTWRQTNENDVNENPLTYFPFSPAISPKTSSSLMITKRQSAGVLNLEDEEHVRSVGWHRGFCDEILQRHGCRRRSVAQTSVSSESNFVSIEVSPTAVWEFKVQREGEHESNT